MTTKANFRVRTILTLAVIATGGLIGYFLPLALDGYRRNERPIEIAYETGAFSQLRQGDVIDRVLSCRNVSTRTWRIRSAHITCSCLSLRGDIANRIIDAGEQISIPVRLEVGRAVGSNSARLIVQLEDEYGERSHAESRIEYDSAPDFAWSPFYLEFDAPNDEAVTQYLFIRPVAMPKIDIVEMACISDSFSLEKLPRERDHLMALRIQYTPADAHRFQFHDTLMLRTNSAYTPYLQIPLVVQRTRQLGAWPSALAFIGDGDQETCLEVYGERGIRYTVQECDGGGLVELKSQTERSTAGLPDGIRLVFALKPALGAGNDFPRNLRLKLRRQSDGALCSVEVPIVVFPKGRYSCGRI